MKTENKLEGKKRWLNQWQIWLSIFVGCMNMELVIIPFILKGIFGLEEIGLKISAASMAVSTTFYWYWFVGWVIRTFIRSRAVEEGKKIGKEAFFKLKSAGLVDKAEFWVHEHVVERFHPERHKKVKIIGIPVIFVSSIFPLPGLWIPAIVISRAKNSKFYLLILILGDIIKNVFFSEIWDFLWKLF